MNFAWVYAMAGPVGWRRWRTLSLDQIAGPDGLDSLRYYWYHAMIASAEDRTAASRAYADSVVLAHADPARTPDHAYRLAIGAHGKALQGDLPGSRQLLAEAEAMRRTMVSGNQAMKQNAFVAAYSELGDVEPSDGHRSFACSRETRNSSDCWPTRACPEPSRSPATGHRPPPSASTTTAAIARTPTGIAASSARKVGVWCPPEVFPAGTAPSLK